MKQGIQTDACNVLIGDNKDNVKNYITFAWYHLKTTIAVGYREKEKQEAQRKGAVLVNQLLFIEEASI